MNVCRLSFSSRSRFTSHSAAGSAAQLRFSARTDGSDEKRGGRRTWAELDRNTKTGVFLPDDQVSFPPSSVDAIPIFLPPRRPKPKYLPTQPEERARDFQLPSVIDCTSTPQQHRRSINPQTKHQRHRQPLAAPPSNTSPFRTNPCAIS